MKIFSKSAEVQAEASPEQEDRPERKFSIGEVVHLRSEKKEMTVSGFIWNEENEKWNICCDWLDTKLKFHRAFFHEEQLTLVPSENGT